MLHKLPSVLDELAALPASRALAKAREAHESARQVEAAALVAFRKECERINTTGGWVRTDRYAQQTETEALKASVTVRMAASEVETARQSHGLQINKHLAKHAPDGLAILAELLRDARDVADRLAQVASAAEADGANVPVKLQRARSAASKLRALVEQFQ